MPTLRIGVEGFRQVQTQLMCVVQIVGVNEVNEEVVPFSEANQILREQDMKGNPLTHLITERSAGGWGVCVPKCVSVRLCVCLTACIW